MPAIKIRYLNFSVQRVFLLLLASLLCFYVHVSGQNFVFDHLNVENGLSQNSVMAIVQDGQGFLWFGTRYGLNRYDGHNFRIYKNNPTVESSISDNIINALYTDSKYKLWVGTQNGLCQYNPEKDCFERVNGRLKVTATHNVIVKCITEDRQGTLWIGTWNGLYYLTDRNTNTFKHFSLSHQWVMAGDNIRSVYADSGGNLWIGTATGLSKIFKRNGIYISQIFRHNARQPGSLAGNNVTSVVEDRLRNIWVATQNGGLSVYHSSTSTFSNFLHSESDPSSIISNDIRKIIVDKTGKLWLATLNGLSVFDPISQKSVSYQHDPENPKSIKQNSIYSIFQDANNSVWLGTYYGGVNITYPYTTAFTVYQNNKYQHSISSNVISAIVETGNHDLWIGTEGGGLNYFNRQSKTFISYQNKPIDSTSLGSNLVKAIYRDRRGNIWIGTHGGGLNLLDSIHHNFKHYFYKRDDPGTQTSEITSLMEDHQKRLWIGSQSGLRMLQFNNGNVVSCKTLVLPGKMSGHSVTSLFEDAEKNIWVGTIEELYVLKRNTLQFRPFLGEVQNNKIPIKGVNCILEDAQGKIWIGLYYAGLLRYNPHTHTSLLFTEKDGLPNDNVIGILEDNQHQLWLSTDNGLSKFDTGIQKFKNYTVSDGLPANEFNYNSFLKTSSGEMFFGGYNGLMSFFPDKIETNNYKAPVIFSSFKLFNRPIVIDGYDGLLNKDISLTKSITLSYNQNVFSIDFALLNFVKSNKNKYAYKLDGFDKNWNYVNTATATYTNIGAGTYTLWVKGANNDGVWSYPASLQIEVLPPFWKTWIAYFFYIVLLAAILFFIARFFFIRALLKREHELNQVKLNFFTNISHEIRTHLSLIAGPVERLTRSMDSCSTDISQLQGIKKNSDSLLHLVNELMDFRKVETGNLALYITSANAVDFLNDIFFSFQNIAVARQIKTDFIYDTNYIELYFDVVQLEKVFFNLLSNAYKFAPDGGTITLVLQERKNTVEISVIDNGKGIAPENLNKLFENYYQENDYGSQNTGYGIGLALSKGIIEQHQGHISVESEVLAGVKERRTCFTVTLLKGNKQFRGMPAGEASAKSSALSYVADEKISPENILPLSILINQATSVLIVEDNTEMRTFLREALAFRYQILECSNGVKGLEMATEVIPDLIISDVMMPEMDGLTLCNKLKRDERTSHIPIILLTAKASTDNYISGLEMGADSYLTKPFSIQVIELQVRNLLSYREKMQQRFSRQLILQPQNIPINTIDEKFLQKLVLFIEAHMDDPEFGVTMLSEQIGMSKPVLYKKLKAITNLSVNDFIKSLRLQKALLLLQQKKSTVYEVAYAVGFNDMKHFRQEFKKQFGKNPSEYTRLQKDTDTV